MMTLDDFRSRVEAFLTRSEMSASRFGREAVGDPNFVSDLRDGRAPSLTLVNKVLAFIAAREQTAGEAA